MGKVPGGDGQGLGSLRVSSGFWVAVSKSK